MNVGTVHIKSFGCQMNKLDTALITAALQKAGFALTDCVKDADVVLINTCSVRKHAEDKVISHLGRLKHIKSSRANMVVAVVGCMAQRLGHQLLEHEAVDIVCGPAQISQVPELINQALQTRTKHIAVSEKIRQRVACDQAGLLDEFEFAYDRPDDQLPGQAFVRAMRGCDKFCTYCVVPYVRGPETSRSPNAISEQIKKLACEGVKQITLLGQTINSYRYTAGDRTYYLADLLEIVSNIAGIKRLRFITSYPADFDESILHAMAELAQVCPYLHIPAQSGSDKILRAMGRNYTVCEYLALLEKARQIVPDIAVAGDFIVGFPGESEQDFEATVELVKKAEYKNCFIFKYSPRPGTGAAKKSSDNVSFEVKKSRNIRLLELQNQISERYNKRFINKTVEVLVEGPSKKPHLNSANPNGWPQLLGRTADDYIVVFNGPLSLAGEFVKVRVRKSSALTLFAELL